MESQPDAGGIELQILAAVAPTGSQVGALAERLGEPAETVHAAVVRLVQAGLLDVARDSVTLSRLGERAAASVRGSSPVTAMGAPMSTIDLSGVAGLVGSLWPPVDAERAAAEKTARDGLLASDAERDAVVEQLEAAFAQGRLSSSELEARTGKALSARTYGDLDDVLQGLGGLQPPAARSHPVRMAVFGVIAVLSTPFVLMGAMFFVFGDALVEHIVGVVFLLLLLPGLFALRRWAWPRR